MSDAVETVAGAGQEVLTFESEDARVAAMAALGDSQDSLEQLERIRNSAIVPKSEDGEGGQPAAEPPEAQPQAAVEGVVPQAEPQAVQPIAPIILTPEELRAAGFTYNNSADVVKGLKEKESYIKTLKEQEALIREQLRGGNDNAQKRIAELEAELARTRTATQTPGAPAQQSQQPVGVQPGGVADAQSTLSGIQAEIAELLQSKPDPYDPEGIVEYQERHTKLLGMQAQAMANLITAQAAQTATIESQRASEEAERQQREREARETQARIAAYAELDSLGGDAELAEFKLSKPSVEVNKDFDNWRVDVASAYYGKRPTSWDEVNFAMEQLELRNADILKKCQLAGIPTEPTQDVSTWLKLLEMMDYRDGWRRNAAGQLQQETRYDAATGQNVPAVLPDLKTAIKMRRLNDGYYKQRIDQAYQSGAQNLATAMTKRDPTVAELNDPSTIRTSGNATQEWAVQFLTSIDPADIEVQRQRGNTELLNKVNEARRVLGLAPIELSP